MRTVEFKAPRPKFKLFEVQYNRQLDNKQGAWFTYREIPAAQYGRKVRMEVWQQIVFAKSPADAATQANKLRKSGSFNFQAPADPTQHAWDTRYCQGHEASGRVVTTENRNGLRKRIQVAAQHGMTIVPKYMVTQQGRAARRRMAGNPFKRSGKMHQKSILPRVTQNPAEVA